MGMDVFSEAREALEKAAEVLESVGKRMRFRIPANRFFAEAERVEKKIAEKRGRLDELLVQKQELGEGIDERLKQGALKGRKANGEIEKVLQRMKEIESEKELVEREIYVLEGLRNTLLRRAREKRIEECKLLLQQVSSLTRELSSEFLKSPEEGTLGFAKERFERAYSDLEEKIASAAKTINDRIREDESFLKGEAVRAEARDGG